MLCCGLYVIYNIDSSHAVDLLCTVFFSIDTMSLFYILETTPFWRLCGIFVSLSQCLVSFTPPCNGGNILVFPLDGSHWVNMRILLEELHVRGHNITVIRVSNNKYIQEKSSIYKSITIELDEGFGDFFDVFLQEQIRVCHYV